MRAHKTLSVLLGPDCDQDWEKCSASKLQQLLRRRSRERGISISLLILRTPDTGRKTLREILEAADLYHNPARCYVCHQRLPFGQQQ
jgi:hypothetical protein